MLIPQAREKPISRLDSAWFRSVELTAHHGQPNGL